MSRAEIIAAKTPDLRVRLTFYDKDKDGPKLRKSTGWGCPCFIHLNQMDPPGFDGWPQFGDTDMGAGETRDVGIVFLSGKRAADFFLQSGKFYLWEGRFIGEAVIIEDLNL